MEANHLHEGIAPSPPFSPQTRLSQAVGKRRQSSVEASSSSHKRSHSPTPDLPAKRPKSDQAISVAVSPAEATPAHRSEAKKNGSNPKKASAKITRRRTSRKQKPTTRPANRKKGIRRKKAKKEPWRKKTGIKNFISGELRPISDIGDIFDDMTMKGWKRLGLRKAAKGLADRTINVATMCSGTESPLLALDMMNESLSRIAGGVKLNFKHLFSAEIVPFKQAYIERNFGPDYVFRDIRQLVHDSKATTAYGGRMEVPGNVDMLIAGFACVDFSNLNKNTKTLDDIGESADTLRSIMSYAKKYRPAIIILENIIAAPWELIRSIWKNDDQGVAKAIKKIKDKAAKKYAKKNRGKPQDAQPEDSQPIDSRKAWWFDFWENGDKAYASEWIKVDSKFYYVPQTRQRVYMCCVDLERYPDAGAVAQSWLDIIVEFQRKASVSVEAFLLPQDDPRIQRAKDELSKVGTFRRETDWERCKTRHLKYREEQKLGQGRPITNWADNGTCTAPDYWWHEWTLAQVERLWDTFEIAFLRNVSRGFDSLYKTRVWELSQNCDRFTDTTPFGVANCVTPSGISFLSSRGGPLTGLEVLMLQGIPINRLLLTRETPSQLQDFAGNAMTSTVVGAAIMSALIAGWRILKKASRGHMDLDTCVETSQTVTNVDVKHLQRPQVLDFCGDREALSKLRDLAQKTVRRCYCEAEDAITSITMHICKICGHLCCQKCINSTTKPSHDYQRLLDSIHLVPPLNFKISIRDQLPMRIQVTGLNMEAFDKDSRDYPDYNLFKTAINLIVDEEHRYSSAKRSHCWTLTYEAIHSRLELIFGQGKVYWLLYGKPNRRLRGNAHIRQLLRHPLARMDVDDRSKDVLRGSWQVCLPNTNVFQIRITGQGRLRDTWEKTLGLNSKLQVWSSLKVEYTSNQPSRSDLDVSGEYELHRNCGTANGSLYKRVKSDKSSPLFLFLDPERIGDPRHDQFAQTHRLQYGETRDTIARVTAQWRPSRSQYWHGTCEVYGRWSKCEAILQDFQGRSSAMYAVPSPEIRIPIFDTAETTLDCVHANTALLSCEIPLEAEKEPGWAKGEWRLVDRRNELHISTNFGWLIARAGNLGGFQSDWRELDPPVNFDRCRTCAPRTPPIKWTLSIGNKPKFVPYEDGRQAGIYERAMKKRPAPFQVQTRINEDGKGCMLVGFNLPTLAHRAVAKLGGALENNVSLSWRLDTKYEMPSKIELRPFTLLDNRDTPEAEHTFPSGMNLRTEQKRSLQWMVDQEADDVEPFYEQEIEEASLSQLGWLAEVRAKKPQKVYGGVLADVVGYGKTATTLALIQVQLAKAEQHAAEEIAGYISLKATLIVVPPHLLKQWKKQIDIFYGRYTGKGPDSGTSKGTGRGRGKGAGDPTNEPADEPTGKRTYVILVIDGPATMNKTTIKEFRAADIVLVSSNFFSSPKSMSRLAEMATLPEGPNVGGRPFQSWLERACSNIKKHTDELKRTTPDELGKILENRLSAAYDDEDLLHDVPTKRLKGAQYAAQTQEATVPQKNKAADEKKPPPEMFDHMKTCKDLEAMKRPSMQMFAFYRIVIDEYTYIDEKNYDILVSLKANRRWVLSGTPRLEDFGDIRGMAGFLGTNLGALDDTFGVLKASTILNMKKDQTDAEQFRALGFSHSATWHTGRQAHAQRWIDQFVRQNNAEIDDIKSVSQLCTFFLGSMQNVVNMELQQLLWSMDMRLVRGSLGKDDSERQRRIKAIMRSSNSAEECLLKTCAYVYTKDLRATNTSANQPPNSFAMNNLQAINEVLDNNLDMPDAMIDQDLQAALNAMDGHLQDTDSVVVDNVNDPYKSVIDLRRSELRKIIGELLPAIRHGTILAQHCRGPRRRLFGEFGSSTLKGEFGDGEATFELRRMLKMAKPRNDLLYMAQFYDYALSSEEQEKEKAYAVKRQLQRRERNKMLKAADSKEGAAAAKSSLPQLRTKARAAVKKPVTPKTEAQEEKLRKKLEKEQKLRDLLAEVIPSEPRMLDKVRLGDFDSLLENLDKTARQIAKLIPEFVSRTRAIRFLEESQRIQQWHTGVGKAPACARCGKKSSHLDDVSINAMCGHLICAECREESLRFGRCLVDMCQADADISRYTGARNLLEQAVTDTRYGSKVANIIELIRSLPKEEQVLMFVQFDDLMHNIVSALNAEGIPNYALTANAGRAAGTMVDDFQENRGPTKRKVLVLNSANASAAGANLTNANHVIFVSPLLSETQHGYDASRTQCIGRAKRYGQRKTVHVYDFLALNTIDVDLYQEQEKKILVRQYVNWHSQWEMLEATNVTEAMDKGWGCGYKWRSHGADHKLEE